MKLLCNAGAWFATCFLSGLSGGCGSFFAPEVTSQSPGIKLPDRTPVEVGFGLGGQAGKVQRFEGGMVFFDPEAPAAQLAALLGQSAKIRELDKRYKILKFAGPDKAVAQRNQLAAQERDLIQQITRLSMEKAGATLREQREKVQAAATAFWKVDPAKKADFEHFCDAAVWQYAASDFVGKLRFSARPTPQFLCEEYYKEKGFFTAPECQPAQAKGDFAACFWGESGIAKTTYTSGTPAELKKFLAAAEWRNIAEPTQRYRKLWDFFKIGLAGKGLKAWNKTALTQYQDPSITDAAALRVWTDKTRSSGEKEATVAYLYQDLLFNYPLLQDGKVEFNIRTTDYEDLQTVSQANPAVLGNPLPAPDEAKMLEPKKQLEQVIAAIALAKTAVQTTTDECWPAKQLWLDARGAFREALLASTPATPQKIGRALYPFNYLELEQRDSKLLVSLTMGKQLSSGNEQKRYRGCFSLATWEPCILDDGEKPGLLVNLDRTTSRLNLVLELNDLESLGMGAPGDPGVDEKSFQAWTNAEIQKKILAIQIYPGQDGALRILTGDVAIIAANGEKFAEGSVSMSEYGEFD